MSKNATQGMDVWCECMSLFCICVVLCAGSSLATVEEPLKMIFREDDKL
jgi:hypothetical protein